MLNPAPQRINVALRTKPQVHEAVLRALPPLPPHSRLLDAPCGEGALLMALNGRGWDLTGLDLGHEQEEMLRREKISYRFWDLNKMPFPFENGSFDAITCVEGIEHLENPMALIREFHRLLIDGGHLILTTPNIVSLRSRVRFLGSGFYHMFTLPLDEGRPDPSHHITPLTFSNLKYVLHRCGFQMEIVTCSYVKPVSWLYLILTPWVAFYTYLAFHREKNRQRRGRNQHTMRWLLSWPVLLGEHLVLRACKVRL